MYVCKCSFGFKLRLPWLGTLGTEGWGGVYCTLPYLTLNLSLGLRLCNNFLVFFFSSLSFSPLHKEDSSYPPGARRSLPFPQTWREMFCDKYHLPFSSLLTRSKILSLGNKTLIQDSGTIHMFYHICAFPQHQNQKKEHRPNIALTNSPTPHPAIPFS